MVAVLVRGDGNGACRNDRRTDPRVNLQRPASHARSQLEHVEVDVVVGLRELVLSDPGVDDASNELVRILVPRLFDEDLVLGRPVDDQRGRAVRTCGEIEPFLDGDAAAAVRARENDSRLWDVVPPRPHHRPRVAASRSAWNFASSAVGFRAFPETADSAFSTVTR